MSEWQSFSYELQLRATSWYVKAIKWDDGEGCAKIWMRGLNYRRSSISCVLFNFHEGLASETKPQQVSKKLIIKSWKLICCLNFRRTFICLKIKQFSFWVFKGEKFCAHKTANKKSKKTFISSRRICVLDRDRISTKYITSHKNGC